MKRIQSITLVIVILTMVLSGCSQGAEATEEIRDTLIVAESIPASGLDPHVVASLQTYRIINSVFDTLVHVEEDGTVSPLIADGYEFLSDTQIKFSLREDITFHNGESLTAEDVVFTFERLMASPSMYGFSAHLAGIEKTGEGEVVLTLAKEFSSIMKLLSSPTFGIVSKKAVEDLGDEAFMQTPVGCGPYQVAEWVSGEKVVLKAYDAYYGESKPEIKTIEIRVISDLNTAAIALESGDVDILFDLTKTDYDSALTYEELVGEEKSSTAFSYFAMNVNLPPFDDINVRKAVYHAIDKEAMMMAAIDGNGEVALNSLYKGLPEWSDEVEMGTYSPELSKMYLAEAGYGEDELEITVNTVSGMFTKMSEVLQGQLDAVGIKVNINQVETALAWEQILGGTSEIFPMRYGDNLGMAEFELAIFRKGLWDMSRLDDDEITNLCLELERVSDQAERTKIVNEILARVNEYYSFVPCFFQKSNVVYNSDLMIGEMNPLNIYRFNQFSWQ